MIYEGKKLVRFGHCDPAGIGFYPRYVEMCHEVVEDWFGQGLGVPFHELLGPRKLGLPAVRLEIEFLAPSYFGDELTFHLCIAEIGTSSMTLDLIASCKGEARMSVRITVVLLSRETGRPVPFDEAWRARLAPYVVEAASP